jgi:hypothetical protein
MTKQPIKKVKEEIEKEEKEFYGDETISGSSPSPESDDDTQKAFEDIIGHEPESDTGLEKEVKAAEDSRRGKPGHKEEE